MSDFRYFLAFVDNYSKMSWMYLLKERTQVLIVIKDFINYKNSVFYYYSCLRADNALEYTQKEVSHFCASHVILTRLIVHTLHNRMRLLKES